MDEDQRPMDRSEYLDHRKSLITLGNEQLATFDKTLILVATGAFGVSAAFLQIFFREAWPIHLPLLLSVWIGLGLTIILNLASYLSSWFDMQVELINFDRNYVDNTPDAQHKNWFRPITMGLNCAAYLSFLFGVGMFVWFVSSNFSGLEHDETPTNHIEADVTGVDRERANLVLSPEDAPAEAETVGQQGIRRETE